jgi:uncharacterized protein YidB (DUF937 family)
MGLLDSVLGAVTGNQGGVQGTLLNAVVGMLANGGQQGGGAAGGLGGLGDLIGKFTQNGMGDAVSSWVGHGQNAPVSPDQVTTALGSDTIGKLAQQLGLSHGETAGHLSQMLPDVIDRLTPHGQAPTGGLGGITDILAQLTKR